MRNTIYDRGRNTPIQASQTREVSSLTRAPTLCLVVLALPLGVGALEVFYAVFAEDP
jgi:hypothetical protein